MVLKPGDSVLVVHRRLFENDKARFFVGTVEVYCEGVAAVNGYTLAREEVDGSYVVATRCAHQDCFVNHRFADDVSIARGNGR